MRLVEIAHREIAAVLRPGDVAIDATVGNGHDTVLLARSVGPEGKVYGFDIQAEAIRITQNRLIQEGLENRVRLVLGSHADFDTYLAKEDQSRIRAVMFNLGYLPRGDHNVITQPQSTEAALKSACSWLASGGRISVLCYTAHPGGRFETERVRRLVSSLPSEFGISVHRPEKTLKATPELIVIERQNVFSF